MTVKFRKSHKIKEIIFVVVGQSIEDICKWQQEAESSRTGRKSRKTRYSIVDLILQDKARLYRDAEEASALGREI